METLLCIDTETSGLDPSTSHLVEIGAVLWSIRYACVVATWSDLVIADTNEAGAINRIPEGALQLGMSETGALRRLRELVARADVLVAHRAEFDASFLPKDLGRPFVCSKFDLEWPNSKLGDQLVHLALAHGVAVARAHRALTDCLLLAHTFEAAYHLGMDIPAAIEKALRPKGLFWAFVSYEEREKAKAAGFSWEPKTKRWLRRMAIEDAAALPFKTGRVDGDQAP